MGRSSHTSFSFTGFSVGEVVCFVGWLLFGFFLADREGGRPCFCFVSFCVKTAARRHENSISPHCHRLVECKQVTDRDSETTTYQLVK